MAQQNNKPVALVTGANQGIGLEVAKHLAANGYTVLVGSRNLQNGENAAKDLGENAHAIQLDVTDTTSISNAAARIRKEFGRLDMLVNNAAISNTRPPDMPFFEMLKTAKPSNAPLDEVRAIYETNVFGVIALTQAVLPILLEAPKAKIVNVSSGVGSLSLNADPSYPYRVSFSVGYAASKTALNAVTLAFAIELENTNVKVYAVSPGFTATALNRFAGTESIEQGSRAVVRAVLEEDGPTGSFFGPDGAIPW